VPNLSVHGRSVHRAFVAGSFGLFVVLCLLFSAGVAAQQAVVPPKTITLAVDGETRTLITQTNTVSEMLTEHQIVLDGEDRCSVPLTSELTEGMELIITRVRSEVVVEKETIPHPTKEILSRQHRVGTRIVKVPGKAGEKAITYRDYYKDGERTARIKNSVKVTPPQTEVVLVGTQGMTLATRSSFGNRRMLELTATAYGPGGNGKWGMTTAMGIRPRYGIVAVDPRVIPLGTHLYVEGYGYAYAADTGGAIKGKRIDLFYPTDRQAYAYGRKKIRVIVLQKEDVPRD